MLAVSISHIAAWPAHSSASAGRGRANQWTEFWPSHTHMLREGVISSFECKGKKKGLQREDILSPRPKRYCYICRCERAILNPALLLFSIPAHSGIPTWRTPRSGIKTEITSVLEKTSHDALAGARPSQWNASSGRVHLGYYLRLGGR